MTVEDGTTVPLGSKDSLVVECVSGTCQSRYNGNTFPCGDKKCTDKQICNVQLPGVPGGSPYYSCNPMSGCSDCSCLVTAATCTCAENSGNFTVTCQGV
jgi:hypothetical protein